MWPHLIGVKNFRGPIILFYMVRPLNRELRPHRVAHPYPMRWGHLNTQFLSRDGLISLDKLGEDGPFDKWRLSIRQSHHVGQYDHLTKNFIIWRGKLHYLTWCNGRIESLHLIGWPTLNQWGKTIWGLNFFSIFTSSSEVASLHWVSVGYLIRWWLLIQGSHHLARYQNFSPPFGTYFLKFNFFLTYL